MLKNVLYKNHTGAVNTINTQKTKSAKVPWEFNHKMYTRIKKI